MLENDKTNFPSFDIKNELVYLRVESRNAIKINRGLERNKETPFKEIQNFKTP